MIFAAKTRKLIMCSPLLIIIPCRRATRRDSFVDDNIPSAGFTRGFINTSIFAIKSPSKSLYRHPELFCVFSE
jgi:hypothetical protein